MARWNFWSGQKPSDPTDNLDSTWGEILSTMFLIIYINIPMLAISLQIGHSQK